MEMAGSQARLGPLALVLRPGLRDPAARRLQPVRVHLLSVLGTAMSLFARKLLFLLPIPVTVVLLNYQCDPANLFSQGTYERGVAAIVLDGKHVANVANYDERLMLRHFVVG